MDPSEPSPDDLTHLRRCLELAREALEAGDEPFGSVLVGPDGAVLQEERNRTGGGDQTRHPELDLARWAALHVAADERPSCTVYTSGEHCPMCSAGHAQVGLGRIVYAGSSQQLVEWRREVGVRPGPVLPLAINDVAPGVPVAGPALELADELRELHTRAAGRRARDDS
ncbi:nucleoside deaminase [Nocardioides hwasunensis]|uniref:Nucleoside deaminase n=1 Tax=Nocardioides hwasunensis TaxID=397258 RepID=A0ABR8MFE8_9ACTN|nr:nucleoside deaminase [Nocardioides hwasunensis]MBD3914693.1 nucleoside deaminase [Nocardioides hwasunensis]